VTDIAKLMEKQLRLLLSGKSTLEDTLFVIMDFVTPGWPLVMDENEHRLLADRLARMHYTVITTSKRLRNTGVIEKYSAMGVFVTSDEFFDFSMIPDPLAYGLILIPKIDSNNLAERISNLLLHWHGLYGSRRIAIRVGY
jgi:hypothetical protein